MDVSTQHFSGQLVKIIQSIATSHFVSFDLEFTGIPTRQGHSGKVPLQSIYEELRQAAQRYQILQVGLTIVEEDLQNGTCGYVYQHTQYPLLFFGGHLWFLNCISIYGPDRLT